MNWKVLLQTFRLRSVWHGLPQLRRVPDALRPSGPPRHQTSRRPMVGFKSMASASIILSGIEMVHMMRKRQARFAFNPNPSLAEQFEILAAA